MFFYEGQACPICGQHFAESDDIVACPECGAPHHRDGWKQEGHCHFADAHGTDRQWARTVPAAAQAKPTRKCPNCGNENPEFAEFCARCGRELAEQAWSSADPVPPSRVNQYTPPSRGDFAPFHIVGQDPFGGIPRTEQIDGIPVETIAEVVGPHSGYYLPRFYKISRSGGKISWNWSAFLIPYNWLLYRKNLLWGILCFVFLTVMDLFSSQVGSQLLELLETSTVTLPAKGYPLMGIMLLTSVVTLTVHILIGLFGNYIYMQQVLRKARKLQEDPNRQYDQSFLRTGGTSFAAGAIPELLIVFAEYLSLLFTL